MYWKSIRMGTLTKRNVTDGTNQARTLGTHLKEFFLGILSVFLLTSWTVQYQVYRIPTVYHT